MLKSTHRQAAAVSVEPPLPAGWTQHKAPTGHTYYYNADTKKSTYTRPVEEPETLQIDYDAREPDQEMRASMQVMADFHQQNPQSHPEPIHFTGGKTYQDRSRRDRFKDRPKSKKPIKNCEPWVLVTTKFRRRFVHNLETKESLWKFPSEVMMAVIEMETEEWQLKQNPEEKTTQTIEKEKPTSDADKVNEDQSHQQDEDSDSYEEVEVTDDEDEESAAKRPRTEEDTAAAPSGPVEFDENDIEWQLAQMAEDGLEEDLEAEGFDEEDEGLPMTSEDSRALFRSLLDDMKVNPYSPFDSLLEESNLYMIEDERWIALPNMSARRNAFIDWSKDRIAELKAQEANEAIATKRKKDPRVQYLEFLQQHATPKLYWPEFKRKFKKEPEIKSYDLTDKDREKIYREYVTKLKTTEADRKKDFIKLLKSLPESDQWNRSTTRDNLPESLLKDSRFYLIRDVQTCDELVEAHLATLKN